LGQGGFKKKTVLRGAIGKVTREKKKWFHSNASKLTITRQGVGCSGFGKKHFSRTPSITKYDEYIVRITWLKVSPTHHHSGVLTAVLNIKTVFSPIEFLLDSGAPLQPTSSPSISVP